MRDYARRFGRQSYLVTAFANVEAPVLGWCSRVKSATRLPLDLIPLGRPALALAVIVASASVFAEARPDQLESHDTGAERVEWVDGLCKRHAPTGEEVISLPFAKKAERSRCSLKDDYDEATAAYVSFLRSPPLDTVVVTSLGDRFKRVQTEAAGVGWKDLRSGVILFDVHPSADLDQYDAEAFCKQRGLSLASGYPKDMTGKSGFPDSDSDFASLEEHGIREVASNLKNQWIWSRSTYPYDKDNAYVYIGSSGVLYNDARRRRIVNSSARCVALADAATSTAAPRLAGATIAPADIDVRQVPYYEKTGDDSKASIAAYFAAKSPKALAINAKGVTYWWGPVATEREASRRALENCELKQRLPCVLVAVDDVIKKSDLTAAPPSAFAEVGRDFDPERVPFLSDAARKKLDEAYLEALRTGVQFVALALNPRNAWYLSADVSAKSQEEANESALRACASAAPRDRYWRRDFCLLYAEGARVVSTFPHAVRFASAAIVGEAEAGGQSASTAAVPQSASLNSSQPTRDRILQTSTLRELLDAGAKRMQASEVEGMVSGVTWKMTTPLTMPPKTVTFEGDNTFSGSEYPMMAGSGSWARGIHGFWSVESNGRFCMQFRWVGQPPDSGLWCWFWYRLNDDYFGSGSNLAGAVFLLQRR
jgi:hypothetical protein